MKTRLLFIAAIIVVVVSFHSCEKEHFVDKLEEVDSAESPDLVKHLSFSVDIFENEEGLEATKSTYDANGYFYFAATDTVGIFPSKGSQVYFDIEGEDVGKQTVHFDGGGWALKESYSYWSYMPLVGEFYLEKTHIPVQYQDLTQTENSGLNHISPVDFLYTDECAVTDGALSFTYHHLNCILRPRIKLLAGSYSKIVIEAESNVFITKGYYDLTADSPVIIGTEFTDHLTLNLENADYAVETAFVGNIMTAPVDISNIPLKVIVYSGDNPVYYYNYIRTTPLAANTPYGLRCDNVSDLTVYANDAVSANAAFASGSTSVAFSEVPDTDVEIVLPATTDSTSIIFPAESSNNTVTVSYASGDDVPSKVYVKAPEGSVVALNTENSTVTLGDGSYDRVEATTAANTLIIPEGTQISTLNLHKGSVIVYGHVETFNCEDMQDKNLSTITVHGSVDGFQEEEGVEIICQPTSISLNKTSTALAVGESLQLNASWAPSYATNVELEWVSSNTSVATVSSSGNVQGIAAGVAVVTVYAAENHNVLATCTLNVRNVIDESIINPSEYLIYHPNTTGYWTGNYRNYYGNCSYVTPPPAGGYTWEIKLKFPSGVASSDISGFCSGNKLKDDYDFLKISNTFINYYPKIGSGGGSKQYSEISNSLSATSTLIVTLSHENGISINGYSTGITFSGFSSLVCMFADYGRENDEGIWEVYKGLPDGTKIYYVKVWDSADNLIYIGHPKYNSTQSAWAWHSVTGSGEKYEYANTTLPSGYSYTHYGSGSD